MNTHAKKGLFIFLLIVSVGAAWLPFAVFAEEGTPPPAEETSTPATSEAPPATESAPEPAAAEIVTGDAVAETEIQNFENTNILDTAPATVEASGTPPTEEGESSTTPLTEESSEATSTPFSTELATDNTASTTNDSVTDAGTGNNSANQNGGDASITTGTAAAGANVLNVVNTNILNSNGFFFLLNNFWGNLGSIDVRGMSAANDSLLACDTLCNGTSTPLRTTLSTDNTADITNGVVVRGTSGGNDASGNGGDASIRTGDAAAAANVVNIANANFVDSNYMLLVFNNFGDWGGDLVFPNKDFFMERFFGRSSSTPSSGNSGRGRSVSVDHENEATVENDAGTTADTGGNETNENGDSAIRSGDAFSQTSVYNQANANFFNTDSFVVLFRVYGNWSGDVFNAPGNIAWNETQDGVALYGNGGEGEEYGSTTVSSTDVETPAEASFAGGETESPGEEGGVVSEAASTTPGTSSSFSVKTKNKASIKNYVRVFALTGANRANRNRGAGEIETGNAYASANIVNIANTNVVGRNWVLAIVNIFGDWNGNVSFGQPDLWVGTTIDVHGGALPDSHPDYHFTVANRGDADATNVKLRARANKPFLSFNGRDVGGEDEWDLGTIPAGTSVEVVYAADVGSSRSFPSYGEHEVVTTATVVARETDNNNSDNTDIIGLAVQNPRRAPRRAALPYTSDPVLTVEKSVVGSTSLYQGEMTGYKVVINNRGGQAYHSVLTDTLKNEAGEVINEQTWELGTIEPNEEITITYETVFGASTTPGVYTNYASLHTVGRHESLDPFLGHFVDSNIASTSVTILYRPPEETPAVGGDGDGGAGGEEVAEANAPSGSGSAVASVTATTTSVTASFVAAAEPEPTPQPPLTVTIEFPPLRKAAFATTSPEPSHEQVLLAAALNARATADEVRLYLILILAAFLINQYYQRRILSGGGFAEFL